MGAQRTSPPCPLDPIFVHLTPGRPPTPNPPKKVTLPDATCPARKAPRNNPHTNNINGGFPGFIWQAGTQNLPEMPVLKIYSSYK